MPTSPAALLLADLHHWVPADARQRELVARYRELVREHGPAALARDGGPEHVTGSCWVLSPDLRRVLLCFHRKGRFWVQTGGHTEPDDASVAATALREAREESGIADLRLVGGPDGRVLPTDLDRHELSGAFGRCRAHWDVGYVALAAADAVPSVSDESEHVAWFDVDELPADGAPGLADRLATSLAELAARGGPARRP
ncbi:NUDIX hydrolase [Actinotalea ferrariae]|uniref:NUDIX hydrolase n=1 Tax=Actinotalea ferrariae TaxID=1386098 RepID=UPI0005521CB7|nr:NUDIX domain-containing protein [Actinotalea ferrariae]